VVIERMNFMADFGW